MSIQQSALEVKAAHYEDMQEIAEFCARIHDDRRIPATIMDLVDLKKVPSPERGFTLVRNPQSGEVVSSCSLIPHTVTYAGIPLQMGLPEFVGTDAAFRRQGLVARQFEMLHRWSEENGDDLQMIGGIPNFYRQFWYEMTITMETRRMGCLVTLDALPASENDVQFQKATPQDIPDLMRLFAQEPKRYLISHHWTESDWLYCLHNTEHDGCDALHIELIRRPDGTVIGAMKTHRFLQEGRLNIVGVEIDSTQTHWDEVQIPILKRFAQLAHQTGEAEGKPVEKVGLQCPLNHPLSPRLSHLFPEVYSGYAWYVRVPHLLAFLQKISPALEKNLNHSPYANLTRTLKLNLYNQGISIEFEQGKIKQITQWQPGSWEDGDFLCPEKVFYHLLFGYRSTKQITELYRDSYARKDNAELVDACFPVRHSQCSPAL